MSRAAAEELGSRPGLAWRMSRSRLAAWMRAASRRPGDLTDRVGRRHDDLDRMTDTDRAAQLELLRRRLQLRGLEPELVTQALALAGHHLQRELGIVPYPGQLRAAGVLLRGELAQMQTGEGKTIAGFLAAASAGLAGIPTHVLTANDYLAKRDADELRPVYAALGLTVGLVQQGSDDEARRSAYAADITYGTGKELAFDFLRDRERSGGKLPSRTLIDTVLGSPPAVQPVLRGLHFAIVDEADSILLDEAVTPFILARERASDASPILAASLETARRLERGVDFEVVDATRQIRLTPAGEARIERLATSRSGSGQSARGRRDLVRHALQALHALARDRDYLVRDGRIVVVDEATGRVVPDRSWGHGLHQFIELIEGCPVTSVNETLASVTYQRLFGMYRRLAGLTATASDDAREFASAYGLRVRRIEPHRPLRRARLGTRILFGRAEKWDAVAERASDLARAGRPVLIGTRTVADSEALSLVLQARRVPHALLNARQDEDEAELVRRAGEPGRVTIATNMAGRGTDIRIRPETSAAGGLHVILTEFHDSRRIDRQLFGRCARQGDPGSCEDIVSAADTFFSPRWAATALRLVGATSEERLHPTAVNSIRILIQANRARRNRQLRRAIARQDIMLHRALAFTGTCA